MRNKLVEGETVTARGGGQSHSHRDAVGGRSRLRGQIARRAQRWPEPTGCVWGRFWGGLAGAEKDSGPARPHAACIEHLPAERDHLCNPLKGTRHCLATWHGTSVSAVPQPSLSLRLNDHQCINLNWHRCCQPPPARQRHWLCTRADYTQVQTVPVAPVPVTPGSLGNTWLSSVH